MPTDNTVTKYGQPTTTGPKPISRYQGALNRVIRVLLRTPLLARGIGTKLLTIEIVGRKSGKTYRIPVAYTPHENALIVGTRVRPWQRNLRPDEPVTIRLRGAKRLADVTVHTGEQDVMQLYDIVARDNHVNAANNGIGFDPDGTPNRADLYQTWRSGGVVLELRLH
jgi:deazaflavin-dependent oxidoreductase (nitroreductase family)